MYRINVFLNRMPPGIQQRPERPPNHNSISQFRFRFHLARVTTNPRKSIISIYTRADKAGGEDEEDLYELDRFYVLQMRRNLKILCWCFLCQSIFAFLPEFAMLNRISLNY